MADERSSREPKHRSAALLPAILALCASVVLAASGIWVAARAGSLRQHAVDLELEYWRWREQVATRLPLIGDAEPGNAWDDYRRGFATVDREWLVGPRAGEPVPEPPDAVLSRLAWVGSGACRSVVRPDTELDLDISRSMLSTLNVAIAARWAIRFELQIGRPHRALECALDVAMFGADLIRSDSPHGPAVLVRAMGLLAEIAAAAPEMLPNMRRPLKSLHDALPGVRGALLSDEIHMVRSATTLGTAGVDLFGRSFSAMAWIRRPAMIFDLASAQDLFAIQRDSASVSWHRHLLFVERWSERWNWGGDFGLAGAPGEYQILQHREMLARLRLMCAAAGLTRDVDPFGDGAVRLVRREEQRRVVFWSVGPDGLDDGGQIDGNEFGFVRAGGPGERDLALVLPRVPARRLR